MSRFPNRRWLVIPATITGSINFNEVLEYNLESLRFSLDGTETFVKYEINEVTESYTETSHDAETGEEVTSTVEKGIYGRPSFFNNLYTEYDHEGILTLLATSEWTDPDPENLN
tara:strand:- start:2076 stop:2417 length:342 start_codon:yes stop_codon:yes gene_type:complete